MLDLSKYKDPSDEEMDIYFKKIELERVVEEYQELRIEGFINSLNENELSLIVNKFIKWEEKFEDFFYMKETKKQLATYLTLFSIL